MLLEYLQQIAKISFAEFLDNLARRNHTLADAESEFIGNQRRRFYRVEVVEFGARLAADCQHIFEAPGRNQSNVRPAALQQSVRADRCAMNHLDAIERRVNFGADSNQSLLDGQRRIGRSGRKFEEFQTAVSGKNKIGERTARVDTDAYVPALVLFTW
jgi:hypothetical protein